MENVILNSKFFDKKIFLHPEADSWQNSLRGGNQKKVLVVYDKAQASASELRLLQKILLAVNLELPKDVLLLALETGQSSSFSALKTQYELQTVLIFGTNTQNLGLHFQQNKYEVITCQQTRFLLADELPQIASDKNLKATLWQALQLLFPQTNPA
ncbi:MAG: hypothetical protein AAGD05_13350 [Bacteroidota bacterium]